MSDWLQSNLALRARRDAVNAEARKRSQQDEARKQLAAESAWNCLPADKRPEVRLGGH